MTNIPLTEMLRIADVGPTGPIPDGRAFAAIRERCGVSTTQLAAAIGISADSVSNYERGRTDRFGTPAVAMRAGRVLRYLDEQTRELAAA